MYFLVLFVGCFLVFVLALIVSSTMPVKISIYTSDQVIPGVALHLPSGHMTTVLFQRILEISQNTCTTLSTYESYTTNLKHTKLI